VRLPAPFAKHSNKVSSYLHHIGPKLSGYSVHNIYSSGVGVIPHPMRSRYSLNGDGWSMHCTPSTLFGDCPTHFRRQSVTGFSTG
jgi:hypothetical protein